MGGSSFGAGAVAAAAAGTGSGVVSESDGNGAFILRDMKTDGEAFAAVPDDGA